MKIIRVEHRDRSANRVFQLLVVLRLASMVSGARVVGYHLDIFGIRDQAPAPPKGARALRVSATHVVNLGHLASLMNSGVIDDLTLHVFAQRMEYLPPPARVRELLKLGDGGVETAADDCLYLHVRGDDVLAGAHPNYWPLPIAHYREVIAESGLRPVFMGQVDESGYCRALRAAFPEAEFLAPASPLEDFRRLMRGRHVATSISTFSWLAAWISPVAERIFQPVAGLLNPQQRPEIDLLPVGDPRYRFRALPPRRFAATPEEFRELIEDPDRGRWLSVEELRTFMFASLKGVRETAAT